MAQPTSKRLLTEANALVAYVPRWQPNTFYPTSTLVIAPTGQSIRAVTDFTSGASYSPANWYIVAGALSTVAGRTGDVVLTRTDVGLSNVDNTSDIAKPLSTATATALAAKADLVGGLIPTNQLPALAIENVFPVASRAAMLALSASQVQIGDVAVDTSNSSTRGSYMLAAADPSQIASWVLLNAPLDVVQSVNGQQGTVLLGKNDIGLTNVDNTADINKPVSTAVQAAVGLVTFSGPPNAVSNAATLLPNSLNIVIASSAAFTVTLPNPTKIGQILAVERGDTTSFDISVSGTVRGTTSAVTLIGRGIIGESILFVAESTTSWRPVASHKPNALLSTLFDANGAATTAQTYAVQRINHTGTQPASTITGLAAVATTGAKADVGLSNVDNTTDANKPISTAQQAALNAKANSADVTTSLNAKADLVNGTIPPAQIPPLALNTVVPVTSRTQMLALTSTQVQPGDVAVDTSAPPSATRGSYMLLGADPSIIGNWVLLNAPTDVVSSVNAQTGTVVLTKTDVGLGNVDNTTDLGKPVSTAQQAALDGKVPTSRTIAGRPLTADIILTKTDVGLANAINPTGTPAAGSYVDGGTGAWTPLPASSGGSSSLPTFAGLGSDGTATFDGTATPAGVTRVSSTLYRATRDVHYTSVSITAGVTLDMAGYAFYARGTVTGPSSGAAAVITAQTIAPTGTNAGTAGAGAVGIAVLRDRVVTMGFGAKSANGGTGAGAQPSNNDAWVRLNANSAGAGGTGGNGSGGSGAAGAGRGSNDGNGGTMYAWRQPHTCLTGQVTCVDSANPGQMFSGQVMGGQAGSSGGGDGSNVGAAGGNGGNVIRVNARAITGQINVTAPGGAGGSPTNGNCGGGGGGAGGIAYVNAIDLSGWTGTATAPGGAGGAGCGTGTAGSAGTAGLVQATTWA